MIAVSESIFSVSSPPLILDSSMPEQPEMDNDFEFFDSAALESTNNQSQITDELTLDDTSRHLSNLLSPKIQHLADLDQKLEGELQSALSASSTESLSGSYRDSSSDSSDYPRKSSSGSMTSAHTPCDIMMVDDTDLTRNWNLLERDDTSTFSGLVDGCINPSAMNAILFNHDQIMDQDHENMMNQDFDFQSPTCSPRKAGAADMPSPEISTAKSSTPTRDWGLETSLKSETETSQQPATQSLKRPVTLDSREASPLPIMTSSQGSSPTFFPSPSPGSNSFCSLEYANGTFTAASHVPKWATSFEYTQSHGLPTPQRSHQINNRLPQSRIFPISYPLSTILTIHPTPLKSRVETQIPIKMTIYPLPIGVTKLHLPTHTISKPKLLAKPTPERSPDTLELYTSLVCTSAMQNPELRKRALERAAASARMPMSPKEESEGTGADEDDENKPANGGEVKICGGCIIRERKRAARKKAKKADEEESWQKYETQRVIVFNTHELKDWQAPSQQLPSEATGDHLEPYVPDGAMQVDAPMRIACYCRHQNEKSGFQVIFTLKDHQDKLVAQAITSSIMITDDHKTSALPPASQMSTGTEYAGQGYGEGNFETNFRATSNLGAFCPPHSQTDPETLRKRSTCSEIIKPPLTTGNSPAIPKSASSSITPRVSRQTSPSTSQGPASKKRKASGTNKVPSALAMTRPGSTEHQTMTTTVSAVPSPFTPNFSTFPIPTDQQFHQQNGLQNIATHFNGPPTPNSATQIFTHDNRPQSIDNLAMHQIYCNPGSGITSRVSSPNGLSLDSYQRQQAQLAQVVGTGLYSIPMSINPQSLPTIHKMIPSEGPKSGGLEVTCLGSGFVQGLEVMFGDKKATTTTYWGDTSLVCLLPPSSFAGNVPVTFKHQHPPPHMQSYPIQMSKQLAYFKYVDDDELQILRTALSVLGQKMTGKIEDVRDLARRIVGNQGSNWATSVGVPSDSSQIHGGSGFSGAAFNIDTETSLLKCLDLIDLDDSPNLPNYNLRRASGQTMLHLACSLGFHRFTAALLARGADPEPKDHGGFTPMHFAALNNHPQIIRRLILSGADPMAQSLQGLTPSNMSTSVEVIQAARHMEYHSNRRSASLKSRNSSVISLRSLWESEISQRPTQLPTDGDDEGKDECRDSNLNHNPDSWPKPTFHISNSSSMKEFCHQTQDLENPTMEHPGSLASVARPLSSSAAMLAVRDHISTQIHQFQQTMHSNLLFLSQMSRFDISQIPALPDYQAYLPDPNPMVRRITQLVNRPGSPKEQDYKWWGLFSAPTSSSPPAYEDIFPEADGGSKSSSTSSNSHENMVDQKIRAVSRESKIKMGHYNVEVKRPFILDTIHVEQIKVNSVAEERDNMRTKNAEKVKYARDRKKLLFLWIPVFIVILLAMAYSRVSPPWSNFHASTLHNHTNFKLK